MKVRLYGFFNWLFLCIRCDVDACYDRGALHMFESGCSRSPMPHPQHDFRGNWKFFPMNNPMAPSIKWKIFQNKLMKFQRFWVKKLFTVIQKPFQPITATSIATRVVGANRLTKTSRVTKGGCRIERGNIYPLPGYATQESAPNTLLTKCICMLQKMRCVR